MDTCFTNKQDRDDFVSKLMRWFESAMRPLPWRNNYEPYGVWISEIMLQQTQMDRGVRYFENWMRRFPDIRAVANASEEEILAAWEGLGYYSRARNLHAAAKHVMQEHGGEFPRSVDAIRSLPGVGEYTAGAIASIAFNDPHPAVDANVLRIFSRICDIGDTVSDGGVRERVTALVCSLMPTDSPRLFNQALMEFGALVCGKAPLCGECPVTAHCLAHKRATVSLRPVKNAKGGYNRIELAAGIVTREGLVLIRKRPPGGLWAGLWEFPGGTVEPHEQPEQAAVRHILQETGLSVTVTGKIAVVRHGYTTNRVTLHGYFCSPADTREKLSENPGKWVSPAELSQYAFPAGHRKLLERVGWKS